MKQRVDEDYMIQLSCGRHEAFHVLYVKYRIRLRKFIVQFVRSEMVADDLVQDVFLKIWFLRKKLPAIHSFQAYLYQMARNAALDYLRSSVIQQHYLVSFHPPERTSQVEEYYNAYEIALLVGTLVNKMPPQRLRVFVMSRWDGLSTNEIAGELHLSRKTVANHLHIALSEIRKKL